MKLYITTQSENEDRPFQFTIRRKMRDQWGVIREYPATESVSYDDLINLLFHIDEVLHNYDSNEK